MPKARGNIESRLWRGGIKVISPRGDLNGVAKSLEAEIEEIGGVVHESDECWEESRPILVINKRGVPGDEEARGNDIGLFDHYTDVFIPIEDGDIAKCRWPVDHRAVRKSLEKGVAFFR